MATDSEDPINPVFFGRTTIHENTEIKEGYTLTLQEGTSKFVVNHRVISGNGTIKSDGQTILCNLYDLKR